MCSACALTKMLVAKLAQMGNFCSSKSDAMWPMVQMVTASASQGSVLFLYMLWYSIIDVAVYTMWYSSIAVAVYTMWYSSIALYTI